MAELVFLDAVIPGRGARVCGIHRLWREWRILAWLAQAEAWLAVRRRMRLASTSDAAGGVITGVPPLLPPPLLLLTLLLLLRVVKLLGPSC